MKKSSEIMASPRSIIKHFKHRSVDLKGFKDHFVRSKIATVYFLESNACMTSSLLTEQELFAMFESVKYSLFINTSKCK